VPNTAHGIDRQIGRKAPGLHATESDRGHERLENHRSLQPTSFVGG
jgi:hypothetical protein